MTKSTKSHIRGLSSLLYISSRVHELVVRAMRGEYMRQGINRKSAVLPLPTISAIPRVRTYHTKEPSRFVHALSARPLKNVWRAWAEPVRQRKQGFSPAFSSGRRWRGLPRRMRCYYSILPKQTLSRYVRTHTFAKSSTARFAIA